MTYVNDRQSQNDLNINTRGNLKLTEQCLERYAQYHQTIFVLHDHNSARLIVVVLKIIDSLKSSDHRISL